MEKSVKSFHPCKSVIPPFYDIVKAHGGELKVETKEQAGTTFTIALPIT
jgi:light-regulated signal transduction histidine kinase (bacteriophytochrome)